MSDYDMSIHHNPDAKVWAEFFMKCYAGYKEPLDEATMLAWFANAMMAMYDSEQSKFRAALAIARADERELCAKVGQDHVVVPRKPTYEMIEVGYGTMRTDNAMDSSEQGRVRRIYRAMIAAAPPQKPADREGK